MIYRPRLLPFIVSFIGLVSALSSLRAEVVVSGELKQWHKVTLTLDGPTADERDTRPNPFTDYNFTVMFTHESGSPSYLIPGYFAADGDAAETSANSGNKWRAHLSPDKIGQWNYAITFRQGSDAAISSTGEGLAPFDGLTGSFIVDLTDKKGRDFRAQGRLTYVGKHHLQFAGSGDYFLKAGADAPETLLAYADFDGTEALLPKKAPLKTWQPHRGDWRRGDPTWQNGKGRGLIGAINYLAAEGMNVFSFLTYNAGGDGDNVWPFTNRDEKFSYDCSKLDQWGILFDHGTAKGMYLHFKLSELENSGARDQDDVAFDEGETGRERKLYLRELIARFGHALALNWNLGEENTQTVQQQRDMAAYLQQIDPYGHLIVTHTPGSWAGHLKIYPHLLGDQSGLTGASLQTRYIEDTHRFVVHWTNESAAAGKPWVVANDEQALGSVGVPPDPGYTDYVQTEGPSIDDVRKYALWATLMGGGAGIEYYFGYKHPQDDLVCEDWRSRDLTWDYARYALEFFKDQKIPFWNMRNADALVGNPENDNSRYCLALPGELYLVYLPTGGTAELDLSDASGEFVVSWFNPRTSALLAAPALPKVRGGQSITLEPPSSEPGDDWLIMLRR
jgi:hypothetical protein